MTVHVATKVGRVQDQSDARPPSVSEVANTDYNAAFVDEDGVSFFSIAGTAAAITLLTATEIATLDGATMTTAELNYLDITTIGVVEASKVWTADSGADTALVSGSILSFPTGANLELDSGAVFKLTGTTVTATGAELNKTDDTVEDVYADGVGLVRIVKATWDFAVDGGSVSAIDLGAGVPDNCLILGGMLDVQTTCQSTGGGTDLAAGAISVEGANDIITAVTIVAATDWDQGLHAIIPVYTAATAIKTTSASNIVFTISVQDMTAGKFTVILFYIPTLVDA